MQLCGVWGKNSVQQLIYCCISVFTASRLFDLISLIKIKNGRPSLSSCVFSQNVGDIVIVLWLQDACGMLVTTLGSGWSRRPESCIDHCKVTSAWVLGMCSCLSPQQNPCSSLAFCHSQLSLCLSRPRWWAGKRSLSSDSGRTQASLTSQSHLWGMGKPVSLACEALRIWP